MLRVDRSRREYSCFNPHPAQGRVQRWSRDLIRANVSILTRPGRPGTTRLCRPTSEYMFQSSPGPKTGGTAPRPDGTWEMFQSSPGPKPGAKAGVGSRYRSSCFNPHPARKPGATGVGGGIGRMFQSSPGPKTGCNRLAERDDHHVTVSILTRPEDRVLQVGAARPIGDVVSILTRPENRVQLRALIDTAPGCFNPHPARRPGATASTGTSRAGFNPHPARRPGATERISAPPALAFQSSPGPKTGCNL